MNLDLQNLSPEKKSAIDLLEKKENLFVTGGAGTGKSFLLNFIKKYFADGDLAITASTGIAAVNISGSTIHSWAGIGLATLPAKQIAKNLFSARFAKLRKKINRTKILAIDEISMLSAETFEKLDEVLQIVRNDNAPMGGLQILLFGDFLQLPPISKYGEEKSLFEKFQSLDFIGMMGVTGAGIHGRFMNMCNGANLAYEKKAFYEVDGFNGIDKIASGDDMLLLQKMANRFPNQICFLKNKNATVLTHAKSDLKSFFQQRIRWASKSSSYQEFQITFILALVFFFCVSTVFNFFLLPFFFGKIGLKIFIFSSNYQNQ